MRVIGLDISLTSTGLSDGRRAEVIQTSPKELMEERMDRITRGIVSFALADGGADLAVIEWSSYGSPGSSGEELAALRYMASVRLWRLHIPVAKMSPATLKLYTTGDGRATKAQMVAAVDVQYGTGFAAVKVSHGRNDMADAYALAAAGYDQAGRPLTVLPAAEAVRREALASAKWPFLYSS